LVPSDVFCLYKSRNICVSARPRYIVRYGGVFVRNFDIT